MKGRVSIVSLGDPVILRHKSVSKKHKSLRTILDIGPLTIQEIETARGRRAYKFEARSKKYADTKTLIKIVRTLMALFYTDNEKKRIRARRWWDRHKDVQNAKRRISSSPIGL